MSEIELRIIAEDELEAAIALEQRCYSPEAAATWAGFQYRYANYRPFFLSAWIGRQLVGITNGIRTSQSACGDEMKGNQTSILNGMNFCVLTVAVDEEHRRNGIGALLLRKLIAQCEASDIENVILMCEEHLIPFYEAEQFELRGISASKHGGITWYEMSRSLHTIEHLTE
ncbi:GNAT family N-acetyltransferase [Paenibacillus sp. LHD-38]|uniref:GNAT family N-acetyltransferase n=1 Tax=Paenibacillus sp. LHD-38 TaxID=3072143 RepID=UPI00280F7763|nr:GNAT family N-acetyltransferase [Paenibacillus sp. LHD-38]MDQ8733708.1 GNAT family N-acetyltransferase [Paenibacillus sp. LHD-38]